MVGSEHAIAVYLALWYVVLVCHKYDVCNKNWLAVCMLGALHYVCGINNNK